ncbi:MAG: TIGR04283 family arsenosugar biosynthesis glycosyltransferase [Calditrichaeota bacterium]|nr:TIGR04283 family arsenosugar biosynthesis glycosyltransferase [Calditrichota bacterium]MCB9365650.1 TIGR04283 family arsenosugar biosynthesis glycosyltransferase [Calditrichota bacterium]
MPPARNTSLARPFQDSLSVIIPTLNEAVRLPRLLEILNLVEPRPELIVVDGGSGDGTVDFARPWADHVIATEPGRGKQLNAGARLATGEILWFLHADSEPPANGAAQILELLHNRPELVGGAFRLKFDRATPALRAIAFGANLRSRLFKMPWGDQGLFVRKSVFLELGGFPDWPIMEDFAFQHKLSKRGKTFLLKDTLTTSARRYEKLGAMKAMAMNLNTLWWHFRGKSPEQLQAKFRPLNEQGGGSDE